MINGMRRPFLMCINPDDLARPHYIFHAFSLSICSIVGMIVIVYTAFDHQIEHHNVHRTEAEYSYHHTTNFSSCQTFYTPD